MIPPAPFCFLKFALAVQGLLCFHTNCGIFLCGFVKNTIGCLTGIALNLQIALGTVVIFTLLIVQSRNVVYFSIVCIVFDFLHQCRIVFCIQVFVSLGRFIPRYFILFDVMVNGIVSLISVSFFKKVIYLAVLSLSCSTWDL